MKVTVVGAGNVGGTLTQRIVEAGLSDVVLVDIAEGVSQGKAFDLADARPLLGYECRVTGTNDYRATAGSDVVVITAGLARQPGMTREDLLKKNAAIIQQVVGSVIQHSPNAILLMVTNPLDVLTYIVLQTSGFAPNKVIGMGGVLDSARFANLIAEELHVSPACVQAMVIGVHGETMIPLARYTTVSGIPLPELLPPERVNALTQRTIKRGAEIVSLLGKGSAYYAPSAAAFSMVKAILNDEKSVVTASVLCEGCYGVEDVCIGVPVCLGKKGVERIIDLKLTDAEQKQLASSAVSIKQTVKTLFQ